MDERLLLSRLNPSSGSFASLSLVKHSNKPPLRKGIDAKIDLISSWDLRNQEVPLLSLYLVLIL